MSYFKCKILVWIKTYPHVHIFQCWRMLQRNFKIKSVNSSSMIRRYYFHYFSSTNSSLNTKIKYHKNYLDFCDAAYQGNIFLISISLLGLKERIWELFFIIPWYLKNIFLHFSCLICIMIFIQEWGISLTTKSCHIWIAFMFTSHPSDSSEVCHFSDSSDICY